MNIDSTPATSSNPASGIMETSMLLKMPTDISCLIFQYVYKSDKVELEYEEDGTISTLPCRLLRVCKTLRYNTFESCRQKALRLVYTVRTPAALVRLCSEAEAGLSIKSICVILFWELGYPLTNAELHGKLEDPTTKPWIGAWRAAFRALSAQTELLIFDLSQHGRLPPSTLKRIMNTLSFTIKHKTSGQARCRIVGCRTIKDQRDFERHTINVISGTDGARERPKWPQPDPFDTSNENAQQRREALAREESGDQFDSERSDMVLPHIKVEYWRKKSDEQMQFEVEERTRLMQHHLPAGSEPTPPDAYEIL